MTAVEVPAPAGADAPAGDEIEQRLLRRNHLEVHVDWIDGVLVVAPVGEIDIVTGGLFLEALIAAISTGEPGLIVDMTQVPFMDSTGVSIFLSAERALRAIDGRLRVVAGDLVAGMFRLACVQARFPIDPDVRTAVDRLR